MTGQYLAMLPMEPKLGKLLILGAIFNCLEPVLTIVAGLSVRDPFLALMDKKDVSDHLILYVWFWIKVTCVSPRD